MRVSVTSWPPLAMVADPVRVAVGQGQRGPLGQGLARSDLPADAAAGVQQGVDVARRYVELKMSPGMDEAARVPTLVSVTVLASLSWMGPLWLAKARCVASIAIAPVVPMPLPACSARLATARVAPLAVLMRPLLGLQGQRVVAGVAG